jgi:PPOX class probable F420-dependent enzyme
VASIEDVRRLVLLDHGLATLASVRGDGSVHLAVVNAGVVDHPVDGSPVAAFVCARSTRKLAHLRAHPRATLQWRAGWAWAAAEGPVELVGPDEPLPGFDQAGLPGLLRAIYAAAGGQHEDWAEYDRVMATERRVAVLVRPERVYVNP